MCRKHDPTGVAAVVRRLLLNLTPQQSAEYLLQRRQCRASFNAWCEYCGYVPAAHHLIINAELQRAATEPDVRVIINVPRGVGKSTYGSKLFPPWFLAQPVPPWLSDRLPGESQGRCILSASHSADLVKGFGRFGRNIIKRRGRVLGYQLKPDVMAADEWETTNGGLYKAVGVGAGVAGNRADLGLIDDFLGNEEDADSEVIRDRQWEWYMGDFLPMLRPGASIVILATPRHEDDLQGRLKKTEAGRWKVIKIPWIAKENDILGRAPGQRIWPEYVTDEMDRNARKSARIFSAQYQQEPTPEAGDVFQADWLIPYTPDQLPKNLRIYVGSDHAITKKEEGNRSVFMAHGLDSRGFLWVLPDCVYGQLSAKEQVMAICNMVERLKKEYGNCHWIAEKCHISDALGPFLTDEKDLRGLHFTMEEVVPKRDKRTRAAAISGLAQDGRVRYPTFAPWWHIMLRELLGFDNLGEDDFVDAHAHVGRKIDEMRIPGGPRPPVSEDMPPRFDLSNITMSWVEKQGAFEKELASQQSDDN